MGFGYVVIFLLNKLLCSLDIQMVVSADPSNDYAIAPEPTRSALNEYVNYVADPVGGAA